MDDAILYEVIHDKESIIIICYLIPKLVIWFLLGNAENRRTLTEEVRILVDDQGIYPREPNVIQNCQRVNRLKSRRLQLGIVGVQQLIGTISQRLYINCLDKGAREGQDLVIKSVDGCRGQGVLGSSQLEICHTGLHYLRQESSYLCDLHVTGQVSNNQVPIRGTLLTVGAGDLSCGLRQGCGRLVESIIEKLDLHVVEGEGQLNGEATRVLDRVSDVARTSCPVYLFWVAQLFYFLLQQSIDRVEVLIPEHICGTTFTATTHCTALPNNWKAKK